MTGKEQQQKRTALLVASLASFLTPFMGSSINVALPVIGKEFGADAILLSWIATSYLLAAAVFLVPFGRIADIIGRKRVFILGIVIFTFASFLCGISHATITLIIFRILQATGSAMIFGTSIAIITSVFPAPERGRAMGIVVAAVYTGLAFGPFAGGAFTQNFGWRSLFFFVASLGLLIIFFAKNKLQGEWADARGEKFDWPGSLLYGISLVLIMYGFPKLPQPRGIMYLGAGLFFLILFIFRELRTKYPVLELKLFKSNLTFRFSNLAALINYSATFAVGFLLSFYLQYFKKLGPQETGLVLVVQAVIMAFFSPASGRLSDRVEPRIVASIGMGLSSLGLLLLAFTSADTTVLQLILELMLLGLGFALFSSPNTNAIMSSVEKRYLGVASGTLGTMRLVGQMLSMGIAMMLFAIYIGQSEIGQHNLLELIKSIKVSFIIFASLCFCGVFASLARGKVR